MSKGRGRRGRIPTLGFPTKEGVVRGNRRFPGTKGGGVRGNRRFPGIKGGGVRGNRRFPGKGSVPEKAMVYPNLT